MALAAESRVFADGVKVVIGVLQHPFRQLNSSLYEIPMEGHSNGCPEAPRESSSAQSYEFGYGVKTQLAAKSLLNISQELFH